MDKIKSSKPMKKKLRWLKQGQIPEQTVDSNCDESESGTVTVRWKMIIKKLELSHHYKRGVHSCTVVTQNVPVLKWHTAPTQPAPLMMMKNRVGHTDRHHSNYQPCAGHCPVTLQTIWYTPNRKPQKKGQ
jgi:hypothetical protein